MIRWAMRLSLNSDPPRITSENGRTTISCSVLSIPDATGSVETRLFLHRPDRDAGEEMLVRADEENFLFGKIIEPVAPSTGWC